MTRHLEDTRPLTWATLTGPSRIMTPFYFTLTTWAGLIYSIDPQGRVQRAPGLAAARWVVSDQMWLWGIMFLALGVGIVYAFATRDRKALGLVLYAASAVLVGWTGFTAWALFLSPDASFVGPVWVFGNALACRATARSVLTREVPRDPGAAAT